MVIFNNHLRKALGEDAHVDIDDSGALRYQVWAFFSE